MGPEHVAYDMRASYGLPYVTPDLVIAWERGITSPTTNSELTALAGVLWCSPGELVGRPRTLREHRLFHGFAPEDVARAVGLELLAYLSMEEHDEWRGTARQSSTLSDLLELSLPDLIAVTGHEPKLTELLRNAATTRWQAYVRPVAKIVLLDKRLLEDTLRTLHRQYHRQSASTLRWGGGGGGGGRGGDDAVDSGQDFLDRVIDHFWATVQKSTG
ncbi:XRE family transcriptional regulator [Streptomyces sp. LBL]|uniref:XRE family transcriptional regulator n=1 Tax=Streptomyces sp. LBL TaxID=2940562 RepID=UPI0032AF6451